MSNLLDHKITVSVMTMSTIALIAVVLAYVALLTGNANRIGISLSAKNFELEVDSATEKFDQHVERKIDSAETRLNLQAATLTSVIERAEKTRPELKGVAALNIDDVVYMVGIMYMNANTRGTFGGGTRDSIDKYIAASLNELLLSAFPNSNERSNLIREWNSILGKSG